MTHFNSTPVNFLVLPVPLYCAVAVKLDGAVKGAAVTVSPAFGLVVPVLLFESAELADALTE